MKLRTTVPLWIGLTTIAFLFGTKVLWHRMGANVILNLTSSVPKGFYFVRPMTEPQYGTIVVFPIPKEVLSQLGDRPWLNVNFPLIKPIAAIAGDTVCISDNGVVINNMHVANVYREDFQGASLPYLRGCFTITNGHFFPVSRTNERSFDGRYFGIVPLTSIIGQAMPLFTW